MKDKFMIHFYRDGQVVQRERFLGGSGGAEKTAQRVAERLSDPGSAVTYKIEKLKG